MKSCFSQIWPSYQLGTVSRGILKSIRLWSHTKAIALRGNQEDRHKSRCETPWNIPQVQGEESKLSYLVKECQRVIGDKSVCKKSQKGAEIQYPWNGYWILNDTDTVLSCIILVYRTSWLFNFNACLVASNDSSANSKGRACHISPKDQPTGKWKKHAAEI